MFQKVLSWFHAQKAAPPSLYQEAIFRYRTMSSPDESVYGDIRPLVVLFPRIELYEREVRKAYRALDENLAYQTTSTLSEVLRCHFYLSATDAFLTPSENHVQFIEHVILLLNLYERKQDVLDQDKILQSTLYRLLPMINNLISLSEALTPR